MTGHERRDGWTTKRETSHSGALFDLDRYKDLNCEDAFEETSAGRATLFKERQRVDEIMEEHMACWRENVQEAVNNICRAVERLRVEVRELQHKAGIEIE